jgi:tRNA(Ile)-lysidine synthase
MADELTILRRLHTFLARHRPNGPVVVAVSGGPDSVALLRAMHAAGVLPIIIAHLNHVLRGRDSDGDQDFVSELAKRLGVEFRTNRRDVATEAAGENLEAAARRIRYRWLTSVAREVGATWIATGHTADDQAETVLFQLLRGSGLDGLAGIAARRPLELGITLVRPMLGVTRADVLAYLESIGQDYRTDATNADTTRSRSRIRHRLLPLLAKEYNPRVVEVLSGLAAQATDWQRDAATLAAELLRTAERPRAGALLVFDHSSLAVAPRRWRRAMWRLVWKRENWPRQEMGYREWDRLAGLCRGQPAAIDLPGGIRARRRGLVIQVGPIDRT